MGNPSEPRDSDYTSEILTYIAQRANIQRLIDVTTQSILLWSIFRSPVALPVRNFLGLRIFLGSILDGILPIRLDLVASGGHEAVFPGRRIYPLKFLTKGAQRPR